MLLALLRSPDERMRFRVATWILERVLSVPAERLMEGPVVLTALPVSFLRLADAPGDDQEPES